MVLKDNVSTIDNKTRMNQEFKSEGQGHSYLNSSLKLSDSVRGLSCKQSYCN